MKRGVSLLARAVRGGAIPTQFADTGPSCRGAFGALPWSLFPPAAGQSSPSFSTSTTLAAKAAGVHAQVSFPYDLDQKQIQLGARLRKALVYALQSSSIASKLRPGTGLSIQEIRMSSDLRTASVLFTALPGQDGAAARELEKHAVTLKQAVSKLLGIKHTPALVFRSSASASSDSAAIDTAFRAIAQERDGDHAAYADFLAKARAASEEGAGNRGAADSDEEEDAAEDADGERRAAPRGRRTRRGAGAPITENDLWRLLASDSDDDLLLGRGDGGSGGGGGGGSGGGRGRRGRRRPPPSNDGGATTESGAA